MAESLNIVIIGDLYYLTQRNNQPIGKLFDKLCFDLLFFGFLIIWGIFILSMHCDDLKTWGTNLFVSGFNITVIDLIVNIYCGIKKELIVTEFFEL